MNNIEYVETTGARPVSLAAQATGSGDVLVWAHALLASMSADSAGGVLDWRELTDSYRIIRYDARGHGQSDTRGKSVDFSWPALGEDLWTVANHFTDDAVVLGGASMGCATTLHAACKHPQRVRGMVLVIPPTAWEARDAMRENYNRTARFIELTRGLPLKLLGCLPRGKREQGFRKFSQSALLRMLARSDYRGVSGAMRGAALSDFPAPEQLAELDIPALILAWPDDDIHPEAIARRLADMLPRAELVIAGNDHEPYQWPNKVKTFLDGLS